MWLQVQEMLRIEKGGEEQIAGELDAYNPLIPQGDELIATMMLEIEDANRRNTTLLTLGGIEESVFLEIGQDKIAATPTEYDDRTTPDGKTSSVHWLRFKLTPDQIARFQGERLVLGIAHKNYGHMAVINDETRAALVKDFSLKLGPNCLRSRTIVMGANAGHPGDSGEFYPIEAAIFL